MAGACVAVTVVCTGLKSLFSKEIRFVSSFVPMNHLKNYEKFSKINREQLINKFYSLALLRVWAASRDFQKAQVLVLSRTV